VDDRFDIKYPRNAIMKDFILTKIVRFKTLSSQDVIQKYSFGQGTLAEGEGSVQLTSSLRWLVLLKRYIWFSILK
jgi:hypothetical protein